MKLLIWSQYFWPERFLINTIATQLVKQGVQVTVLTGKPNYPGGKYFAGYSGWGIKKEHYNGINIIRIPIVARGKKGAWGLFCNYISFIVSGYFIAPFVLRGRKFDSILVYGVSPLLQALPAIVIKKQKKAKLVTWVQDLWPESLSSTGYIRHRKLLAIVRSLVKYIYRQTDTILVQSEGFYQFVKPLVDNREKIKYYPNCIVDYFTDSSYFASQPYFIGQLKKHFSVVFAGNMGKAQNCAVILKAALQLQTIQDIKFYMIGEGSEHESLKELAKELSLSNVKFTGAWSSENMPMIYHAASLLLLTLKSTEAFDATIPSKLQTYLASGKPIVASVNGEAGNIIRAAKAGIAVEADNEKVLAEAILTLYHKHSDELKILGNNARQYFKQHFDLNNQLPVLIQLLQQPV